MVECVWCHPASPAITVRRALAGTMLALQDLPDQLDQLDRQEQRERLVRLGRPDLLAQPEPPAQLDLQDRPAPQDRPLLPGHPMFGFARRHTYPVAGPDQPHIYMFLTAELLLPM